MKRALVAIAILIPAYLTYVLFQKQNSTSVSNFKSRDYSFRVQSQKPESELEEPDEDADAMRVAHERATATQEDRTRLAAASDFCKMAQQLNARSDTRFAVSQLSRQVAERGYDIPKDAAEIFSDHSPLFSPLPPAPTTRAGKFLLALRKSGMLEGLDWEQPDFDQATSLMTELRNEDPDNAAPLLFQLMIEKKKGTDLEDLGDLLRDLVSARKFDTFYTQASRQFRDAAVGWQDPLSFMLVTQILSVMPVPNYQSIPSLVNEMSESAPELREHLADLMTQEGRDAQESSEALGYNVLDYSFGRAMTDRGLPRSSEIDQMKVPPPLPLEAFSFDTQECSDHTYLRQQTNLSALKSGQSKY